MDPYLIFGVDRTADFKTIKKKYHKLSLLYHPDKAKDKEDLEKRKEMFQLISLSYERIQKEKGMKYNDNENKIDIKEVIDNVCDIINSKWKEISDHPLYRVISNLGIRGLMKIFQKNPEKYSIMSMKCSYIDIINNAKIKGDYYRNDKNNKEEIIYLNHELIYPYILIEEMGDYNEKEKRYKDLVIFTNLTDRSDFEFDYRNKCIHIKNKESLEMKNENLLFNTQFGIFIVK